MKYAVIVWTCEYDVIHRNGSILGWFSSMKEATARTIDLMKSGAFKKAVAVMPLNRATHNFSQGEYFA